MLSDHSAAVRLRIATGEAHRELDRDLNVVERLAAPGRRAEMLRCYHRLHAAAEPPIAAFLAPVAGLEMHRRSRLAAIAGGLAACGGALPPPPPPLSIASRAEALGGLYVLEGSTLGGRTILRALQGRGADTAGLGFLDPYGASSGAMWRRLMDILQTNLADDETALQAACGAALTTFGLAAECLGGVPAEAS